MVNREFVVANAYRFNQSSAVRWIVSHLLRYRVFFAIFILTCVVGNAMNAGVPILIGMAFNEILRPAPDASRLALYALGILALTLARSGFDLGGRFIAEILGKRVERDARDELYLACWARARPSTTGSGSATSWRAPPTTSGSSAT